MAGVDELSSELGDLTRGDLGSNPDKVSAAIRRVAGRVPTYVTINLETTVNKPVAVKATDSPAKAVGAAGATVSDSTSGAVTLDQFYIIDMSHREWLV